MPDLVTLADQYGVNVRLDPAHRRDKVWNVPHLNIGKGGQMHVPIPKGYQLP